MPWTVESSAAGGADAPASPAKTGAVASGDVSAVLKKEMPWCVASISGGNGAWDSDGALLPVSSDIMVYQIAIKIKKGGVWGCAERDFSRGIQR